MRAVLHDIRLAVRGLLRAPAFASIAVSTIALGIGANTAIFSVVNGVLLEPLEFDDAHELVTIWGEDANFGRIPTSVVDFRDIREQSTAFAGIAARWTQPASLHGDGDAEEVTVGWVTENYFSVLRVHPALGSLFAAGDPTGVILNHELWQRRYGGDPGIIGRSIRLGRTRLTVMGVFGPATNPNFPSTDGVREHAAVWRLMPESWLGGDDRITGWLRVVARLNPGTSPVEAQSELDAVAAGIRTLSPAHAQAEFRLTVTPVLDNLVAKARPTLLALMGAVGFVLLIACSNVANLLLVRGQARAREIAVRAALGGGRHQIIRQLLAESGVLALLGGTGGVLLALVGVRTLAALRPAHLPRLEAVHLDGAVLAFAVGASALAALLFGIVPAIRASRIDLIDSLRDRTAFRDRSHHRLSRGLIVAQVALSLILLVGAGLLLRSFGELRRVRPGFDIENVLTMSLTPSGGMETREEGVVFYRTLTQRIEALPGVSAAGVTNRLPLGGGLYGGGWATEAMAAQGGPDPEASFRFVSPNFFRAAGTRLITGRFLRHGDGEDVILVDEKLAALAWPGEDPIGKLLRTGELGRNGEWSRVIGVVEHMRHASLTEEGRPTVFLPDAAQGPNARRYLLVRTATDPERSAPAVREVLRTLDPNATMARVRTMEDLAADAMAPTRFALVLIAVFAGIAVGLAAVGLYGVVSYSVGRRAREIGIRIALGAQPKTIVRLVVRQGLLLTTAGIGLGLLGAFGLTRIIAALLYGVTPTDVPTFVGVVGLLVGMGLLGCYLPARRALRVDPTVALREE